MSSKAAYAKAKELMAQTPEMFKSQEPHSLARKITDSDLYDWNATARFLLTQIAVLAMPNEDASYPDDAPDRCKNDKTGWCWMSQKRLALKIGKSLSTVEKLIAQFRKDGVINYRDWRDDNKTLHAEYRIVEEVLDAHQRPSQRYDDERPSRYKDGSRKGLATKQPRTGGGKFTKKTAVWEEDDE
jgi:hypothetical protein